MEKIEILMILATIGLPLASASTMLSFCVLIILEPIVLMNFICKCLELNSIQRKIKKLDSKKDDKELKEFMKEKNLKTKRLFCYSILSAEVVFTCLYGVLVCTCGYHYFTISYLWLFFIIQKVIYFGIIRSLINKDKCSVGLIITFIVLSILSISIIFIFSQIDIDKMHESTFVMLDYV